MKVLITGANGFVGKNLQLHLAERSDVEVICFTREHPVASLPEMLWDVEYVFHLAGINRPQDPQEFVTDNASLTDALCVAIASCERTIPVIFTSSIQAERDNPYGASKRAAEDALFSLFRSKSVPVHVFRLPNVFGKWCRPNYNSVVATFCHNIARGLPIRIDDPLAPVRLVYVDDVVQRFIQLMDGADPLLDADGFELISPQYDTTVGEIESILLAFRESRTTLMSGRVGTGFHKAMHATYLSYLPAEEFAYIVPQHADDRGSFVEMLKTPDCGQFSYFTAHPGITRGGHYHHTKTEKFLVIKGLARFRFRHMLSGEICETVVEGGGARIVETVPGWSHDITNIGDDELIVMLWANEVFDPSRPDTYVASL